MRDRAKEVDGSAHAQHAATDMLSSVAAEASYSVSVRISARGVCTARPGV